jgi:single-strand DNA-binding protein
MTDIITITGLVGTDPREINTKEGLSITSFRLGSTQRRYDRTEQKWVDGDTNWYTVTAFRQLAVNSLGSIKKGQRAIVTGKVKMREWTKNERTGVTMEIEAEAIGHDLLWGTSQFTRTIFSSTPVDPAPDASGDDSWASTEPTEDQPVPF